MNYKIRVANEAESKEAQGLLFELGYKWIDIGAVYFKISPIFNYITAYCKGKTLAQGYGLDARKEITIPQLKDMVVLERNDVAYGVGFDQDNVNQPSHYNKGGVECIDAIQSSMTHEAFCGYLKGNVQKYMWRYENKGGVESLEKAQWYLNKLIEVRNETSSED